MLDLLQEHVAGLTIGPFSYDIATRRGKRHLLMRSDALGAAESLSSKLDVSSPSWLEPVERGWVSMPVHAVYGGPLPLLPVVRLEENLAEKIARLNRVTPARDLYDLAWVANHHLRSELDVEIRRPRCSRCRSITAGYRPTTPLGRLRIPVHRSSRPDGCVTATRQSTTKKTSESLLYPRPSSQCCRPPSAAPTSFLMALTRTSRCSRRQSRRTGRWR